MIPLRDLRPAWSAQAFCFPLSARRMPQPVQIRAPAAAHAHGHALGHAASRPRVAPSAKAAHENERRDGKTVRATDIRQSRRDAEFGSGKNQMNNDKRINMRAAQALQLIPLWLSDLRILDYL